MFTATRHVRHVDDGSLNRCVIRPSTRTRHCYFTDISLKYSIGGAECRSPGRSVSGQARAVVLDDPGSVSDALPVVLMGSMALALGLVKVMAYSQLEVVRTAMLSRHVKQGNAKVLQLGGTTRDMYYYPSGTVKISVNDPTINRGIFEQAGITVGIPVEATSLDMKECLCKTPSSSVDSVVSFEQFGDCTSASELSAIVAEIERILKPGGTFIFYQRLANGGFAQLGSRAAGSPLDVGDIISSSVNDGWDFCEYDIAAGGLDAHAVGVAIRSMANGEDGGPSSVDDSAFEEMLKKQKRQQTSKKAPSSRSRGFPGGSKD